MSQKSGAATAAVAQRSPGNAQGANARKDKPGETTTSLQQMLAAGNRLYRNGRQAQALSVWRRILEKDGLSDGERSSVARRMADAYFESAVASGRRGRNRRSEIAKRIEYLEAAVRLQPDDLKYLLNLAATYETVVPGKAAAAYRRAIENGAGEGTRQRLIALLVRNQMYDEALEELARIPVDADNPALQSSTKRMRMGVLVLAERYDEALELLKHPTGELDEWATDVVKVVGAMPATEKALQTLEQALDLLEGQPDEVRQSVASLAGNVAAALGQLKKALTLWDRAFDRERVPLRAIVPVLERLAFDAVERGDIDEAISYWQELQQRVPNEEVYKANLASAMDAVASRRWAEGDVDGAVAAWKGALATARKRNAIYHLAAAFDRLGRHQEANDMWGEWLTATQSTSSDATRDRVRVHYRRLANFLRQGEMVEAVKEAGQLKRLLPKDMDVLLLCGHLLLHRQEAERAAEVFQQALALSENHTDALIGLALSLEASGANKQAAPVWERLAQASVDHRDVAQRRQRRIKGALGVEEWKHGRTQQAMQQFADILLANPKDVDAWVWCGTLHLQGNNEVGATDCFTQALELRSDDAHLHVRIGGCYLAANQRERADEFFDKARKLESSVSIDVEIGAIFAEMGQKTEAVQYYRSAIQHADQGNPLVMQVVRYLCGNRGGDDLVPLLELARKSAANPLCIDLLLAVERIRAKDWRGAQDLLDAVAEGANQTDDAALRADVHFYQQALILLRTVGSLAEASLENHTKQMLDRWVQEHTAGAPSESAGPQAWSVERLVAQADQAELEFPLDAKEAYLRSKRFDTTFHVQRPLKVTELATWLPAEEEAD